MSTIVLDPPETAAPGDAAALLAVSVRELADDGVADHLAELHRLRAIVDAAVVEATDVFDARAAWSRDGARSGPSWVAARCPTSHGAAKADVHLARDLRTMPATAAAFGAGRIGREQVRLLAKARADGLDAAFAACEDVLVDEVAASTVAAGARFLRRWQAEVRERFGVGEPDGAEPSGSAEGSSVHLSCSFEGRWVLDGSLDAESGEIVANAIDAQVDSMFTDGVFHGDDGLLPSERRAIALVELVTRGARGGEDDGTARPLVLGVVHLRGECGAAVARRSSAPGTPSTPTGGCARCRRCRPVSTVDCPSTASAWPSSSEPASSTGPPRPAGSARATCTPSRSAATTTTTSAWVAGSASPTGPSAGPSASVTAAACSPAARSTPATASPTTSNGGSGAAPRTSRTSSSSAASTTRRCTIAASS